MGFQAVLFEKDDGLAVVTLNRPRALNAINVEIRDELFEIVQAIAEDAEVGAVLIRGAGRAFSAGADVTEFGTAPSPVEARRIRTVRPLWQRIAALEKPIIAAIHGFAIGAGMELAALCDLRIAAEGTVFAVPEVSLGLIPGAGGSQTLPRLLRPGAALRWILSGERFDAAEALRIGLVQSVVPGEALEDSAERLARSMLAHPWPVLWAAKRAINAAIDGQPSRLRLPTARSLR